MMANVEDPPNFTDTTTSVTRFVFLDVLRALAIVFVICHHVGWRIRPDYNDIIGQTVFKAGWIGVDLFFAISGFLITQIVTKNNFSVCSFFRKRAFRILPLYLLSIIFYIIAIFATGNISGLDNIWSPIFILNGWTIPILGEKNTPFVITWSISVEEAAYAIFGVAAWLGRRYVFPTLLGLVIGSIILRITIIYIDMIDVREIYYFVPARLDAIAIGGLAALGLLGGNTKATVLASASVCVGLVYLFSVFDVSNPIVATLGYSLFSFAAAKLIIGLRNIELNVHVGELGSQNNSIMINFLGRFGKLSYFIYLFHLFVIEILIRLLSFRFDVEGSLWFWGIVIVCSIVTYLFAEVSWRWFESPLIERAGQVRTRPSLSGRRI